ncbi:MAG: rhodanese-like domain-containing protein [Eggerthellaceae bacterium]|nr:rhodanese-like domain-containing protein [Eggerthellaceae bacterium]
MRRFRENVFCIGCLIVCLVMSGCAGDNYAKDTVGPMPFSVISDRIYEPQNPGDEVSIPSYTRITHAQAKEMMEQNDDILIIDVRRPDEYASGHIPGAINIPNETINDDIVEDLPDMDKIMLVYCRSGARSAEASQKFVEIGYSRVFDFGGIMNWTGEITL